MRNALLGGGAAAGLASVLAKPDHAYKWARAGFAGGAAIGALVNPRKRAELSASVELGCGSDRDKRMVRLKTGLRRMRGEGEEREGFLARNKFRIAGIATGIAAAGALATWKDRGMRMKYEPGHTVTDAMIGRPPPEVAAPPPSTPPPSPTPKGPTKSGGAAASSGLPRSVKAQMRGPGRRVSMPGKSPRRKKELEAIAANVRRLVYFNEQDERQSNRFTPSVAAGTLYRKGRRALVGVKRTGNLAQDVADVAAGRKAQGRREWEKSWFKNAIAGAALGAALGAPRIYAKVVTQRSGGADNPTTTWPGMVSHFRRTEWPKVKSAVRTMRATRKFFAVGKIQRALVMLDMQASINGWDVRDPRGKSARVFAPGSRRRERREKTKWEKVDTIRAVRNAAIAAAVAGAAGSGVLGWQNVKLRRKMAGPAPKAAPRKVVPGPWPKSG